MNSIEIDNITKIEGHAKLSVKLESGQVKVVHLDVVEGARYFEAMVKGRNFNEVPMITSRICGICSQAHSLASLQAIEKALGVKVSNQTMQLRNLLHLGSLIQSHALHLYFLALPDYLGFDNAVAMAQKRLLDVKRGLLLKRLGNRICEVVSGRQIHSITCVVGGFSNLPSSKQLLSLKEDLQKNRQEALMTVSLFSKLKMPKLERKTVYLSLKVPKQFSLLQGNVVSSQKTDFKQEKYRQFLTELVLPDSTAKNVLFKQSSCMVGSLARLNNGRDSLSFNAKRAAKCIKFPCYNPFMNNLCQAIEIVSFIDKSISIIEGLELKEEPLPKIKPRSGHGISIIEAPRGLLIHECKINSKGDISDYNIIAPTTINIKNIEEDISALLPSLIKKPEKEVVLELEKLIRAYDPCISCSAHFLELNWT
ncbi:MAG: Ni/Fe hydrogenase subunit alpha [Candidatus Woesearchaeota archaeon]